MADLNLGERDLEFWKKVHEYRKKYGWQPIWEKYWDPVYGFDLVKFDEDLGTPEGKSCSMQLREKFGAHAVSMAESLIWL